MNLIDEGRYALLAQRLRPYLLDLTGSGAAAAAGGMLTHDLSGPYHSGTLGQSQAPWAATVTALNTHVSNPNAHHNAATGANAEITVSAAQVVTLAAHDILARHSYSGGANLDVFGLSAASTLAKLTPSSDVSAGASALLRSNAGALTVRKLTVDGDDLTVEGIGSYDGYQVLVVDASAGSVGIMGTPDPQFALDIVGPARASYWIGPHAIQLKDVLLLAHFDGRQPFETNYAGAPNGHMGQVAAVGGGVIYRPGMFGTKAVQIAEGKVNYVPNPSFEVNSTDGWLFFESGTGASRTRTSTRAYVGTYSCRIDPSSTGNAILYTGDIVSVPNAGVVSASARLYRNSAGTAQIEIYDSTNSAIRATGTSAVANEWEYVSCTWTNNTGGAVNVRLRVLNTAGGTANALWVDACQVELGVNTPYIDGTLGGFTLGGVPDGTGHAWSGTAHNSTSSRVVANFAYPTTGNIDAGRGTVMGWVWRAGVSSTDTLLRVDGSTAGLILLRGNGTQAQAYWGTASISGGTIAAGVWTHLAMTFNGTTLRLYVNGVEVASGAASGFDGMPATMGVGRSVAGANFLNGYLDDLCITSSVLPADGIRAVYESNAPVFAESSRFSFRATPKGLVWADDEGLWMRDTTGAAVLGAYGGETSKSWSSVTLDPGDVLIGTSASYAKWDSSAATFSVKGAITADSGSIAGALTIGASGGIYQGSSGSFGTPGTGLKIWNDSGVGRIAAYNGGTFQAGFDSNGNFLAGTTHKLNTGGLTVTTSHGETLEYGVGFASGGENNAGLFYRSYDEGSDGISWLQLGVGALSTGTVHDIARLSLRATRMQSTQTGQIRISTYANSAPYDTASIYLSSATGASAVDLTADDVNITADTFDVTGAQTISSTLLVQGETTLTYTLKLGWNADYIARIKPTGANVVADSGTLALGYYSAMIVIIDNAAATLGRFMIRGTGNSVYLLEDYSNIFSTTKDTANKLNVYYESSNYYVQNKRGSSRTLSIYQFGTSATF